jgi:hypothetical protein
MTSGKSPNSFSMCRVLLVTTTLLVCLVAVLSHKVLQRGSLSSRGASFELTLLAADVRTIVSAISYLLDPEPADPSENAVYSSNLKASPQGVMGTPSNNLPDFGIRPLATLNSAPKPS